MKCDRCAYCCVHYDVIVPVDPEKGIAVGNMTHKPSGKRCHHNLPDGTCAVHDKSWYKDLSCHHYDYGDGQLCPFTPGVHTARQLLRSTPVHDPSVPGKFAQEILMLLNDELVEKNKAARSRLDSKRGGDAPLYDPKDR